jgi:toxin YoeB
MYRLVFSLEAEKDAIKLNRSELQAYKKLGKLIQELKESPETGMGHPKPLGSNRTGQWSRRITQKHRLTYKINKEEQIVEVISVRDHYDD